MYHVVAHHLQATKGKKITMIHATWKKPAYAMYLIPCLNMASTDVVDIRYSGRSTFHLPFVCSCRSHNLGSLCGPFAHDCSRVLTRARSNTSLLKQPNNYAPRCYFVPPYFRTLTREHSFPAESHTYGQKTKAHQYWVFQSLRTMLSQSSIQPLTAYSRNLALNWLEIPVEDKIRS